MRSKREQSGYSLSPEELKKVQSIQMELISEVDRICKKCGIRYNMVGGTMLGAIRHKGYIPWDDDADIGFLRKEYEKFREACILELNHEKYYLQDFRDTEGYRWGYGKLRRKHSEFVRLNQEFMPYEQGIFIDLMPFDDVPDAPLARRIHFLQCFIYRKFFWSKVGSKSEECCWKRVLYRLMSLVPEQTLKKRYAKFIRKHEDETAAQVRILTFPTPKGVYGYNREWYEELEEYEFDGKKLPGAKDYDGYLCVKYNNYMQLPPEEKRKVHAVSKLVLPKEGE